MAAATKTFQSLVTKASWLPKFAKTGSAQRIKPNQFTIDCAKYQGQLETSTELKARVNDLYQRIGLVYLTNTATKDADTLQKPFTEPLGLGMVYEGGANPRSQIEGNVYDTGVSMESFVHYHHEMAYISKSVRNVAFFCRELSPGVDGATYVSDNVGVNSALEGTILGRKLKEKGVCYVRKLTDREYYKDKAPIGVYNHWQKSFLTEDPKVAEKRANEKGLIVEWGPNRHMITKYYCSAYEWCPQIDKNLLYTSLADHSIWFDTWPMVKELPQEERPLKLTYGDNSEFSDAETSDFVDIYDEFGMKLPWQEGDAALVCNYRWLHGRPVVNLESGQKRELGVVLGPVFERVGPLPNKW